MAIYFQGMTPEETTTLTMKMKESGHQMDFSSLDQVTVDKHSTGGVGDKVSIPLAPIVAACGVAVPMISGRGLGHTCGTLDKLEAIPGYTIEISEADFIKQVDEVGCAIVGATGDITPADKKIYALRDVTATVDSLALITGSIMSKKIAAGAEGIVLDIKVGSGAFMKDLDQATELAESLVTVGKQAGLKAMAVISDMNQPLGHKIGNSLEIEVSIDLLKGKAPEDITELTVKLTSLMLVMSGVRESEGAARELVLEKIASGEALAKFREMVEAQGGNSAVIDDYSIMPQAKYRIEYLAKQSGVVAKMQANDIGICSMMLGGGRQAAEDQLNYSVGIELHKKIGDQVEAGQPILTLVSNQSDVAAIEALLDESIGIAATAVLDNNTYVT